MAFNLAIMKDEPPTISATKAKTTIELYKRWERSNRLSIMFIKTHIFVGICGSVEKHDNVRDLLKEVDEQFTKS